MNYDQAYRVIKNKVDEEKQAWTTLEEILRLLSNAGPEIKRIEARRDQALAAVEEANRQRIQAEEAAQRAKDNHGATLVKLKEDLDAARQQAQDQIKPTIQRLEKLEGAIWDKTTEMDKMIKAKQAVLDEKESLAKAAEDRLAMARSQLQKHKDEMARLEA